MIKELIVLGVEKYRTVVGGTPAELDKLVNDALKEGFVVYGPIKMWSGYIMQTMIKQSKE